MYKKRFDVTFSLQKRGQITIFIILGILLVLALVLVVVLKTNIVKIGKEEVTPTTKGDVESLITTCINNLGEEALLKIGVQGGYITVPADLAADANHHLRLSPFQVLPYWAEGSIIRIPPLSDIKFQVDLYIEQHLQACVFGLGAFQQNYDLIEKSSIKADTTFTQSGTLFTVHWNIEVRDKQGEVKAEVLNHVAQSKIQFATIHHLASRIIEKEMSVLKFEDLTQDLLALEHPQLPVAGLEISCSQKTWEVTTVQQTFQNILHINIPQVKIKGTNLVEFPEALPYYQNHYVWDIGEDINEQGLSVYFDYQQNFPFTFAVTPLSGATMHSSQLGGTNQIPLLCIQNWKFTYDAIYPVLARIHDENANYDFNFAFTVHLLRNMPNRGTMEAFPSFSFVTTTNEDYCKDRSIPTTVKTYEHITNDQGVSNKIDLGNVNLSFTCLKYRCELGPTEYTAQGFSGLVTNLPYCVGGILRGTKEGYKEDWQRLVTAPGKEVELNMIPLLKVPRGKITILKHEFSSPEKIGIATPLASSESAIVKITYRRPLDPPQQPFHDVTWIYEAITPKDSPSAESLSLLAGADYTYHLDVTLLDNQRILGGYQGNWTIPWEDVPQAQEFVIHVLSKEQATEQEQTTLILNIAEQSKYIPKPEIR